MHIIHRLDGFWWFQIDPDNSGEEQLWYMPENFPYLEDKIIIPVPSCWKSLGGKYADYNGTAWYFTTFRIPPEYEGKRTVIRFAGVNENTTVYLDGEKVASHSGGFTPFGAVIPCPEPEKEHFLAVKVECNNGFSGGIYDSVELDFGDWVYVDDWGLDVKIVWKNENEPTMAKVTVKTFFKNETDQEWMGKIIYRISHEKSEITTMEKDFNIQHKNSRLINTMIRVDPPMELWTPDHPFLYDMEITVVDENGKMYENLTIPFGIREYTITDDGIKVNSSAPIYDGLNCNADNPEFGFAVPPLILMKTFTSLKNRGVKILNFPYTPAPKIILDMADRYGFMVIQQLGAIHTERPDRMRIFRELISRDRYHTCIVSWNAEPTGDPSRQHQDLTALENIMSGFDEFCF